MDTSNVLLIVRKIAKAAGVQGAVSPHWLRHSHASHSLERGATVAEVRDTLGHGSIATTSAYLHARPDRSSGLRLAI
jgi:integrase/recombinase XerD